MNKAACVLKASRGASSQFSSSSTTSWTCLSGIGTEGSLDSEGGRRDGEDADEEKEEEIIFGWWVEFGEIEEEEDDDEEEKEG